MGKPGGALRRTLVTGAVLLLVGLGVQVIPKLASPAHAGSTTLCSGFSDCRSKGYSTGGYEKAWGNMYWRMYAGRNCTNYVAYKLIKTGLPNARPWSGEGNATNWGVALSRLTNRTPTVGSVAWWHSSHPSASRFGHVAIVERVGSESITISESNHGSDLSWRRITKGSRNYPTGFIHINDKGTPSTKRLSVTKRPTVSGTAQVGKAVTVNTGSWSPNPNKIRYQWIVDKKPIPGATNKTFRIPGHLAGKQIAAVLTGTRDNYSSAKTMSTILPPIKQGAFKLLRQPTISGTQKVGSTVSVGGADYEPTAKIGEIRWYADKTLIARTKSRFLKVPASASGKRIGALVVGVQTGYKPKHSYAFATTLVGGGKAPQQPTEPTEPPSGALAQTGAGFVKGGTRLGGLMQVNPGTFSEAVDISYQWTREGTPISGATTEKYRPTASDVGHRLSVTVVARSRSGETLTKTYGPSGRVRVKPRVNVVAADGSRQTKVDVRVTASGYTPTGSVTIVTNGDRKVTQELSGGSTSVTFVKLPPDEYVVKVYYRGDEVAYWASGGDWATVR